MNGYKIVFLDNGSKNITWFGEPMTNVEGLSNNHDFGTVALMFAFAHPGCEILSIEPCTIEQFAK